MHRITLGIIILSFSVHSFWATANSPDTINICRKAFMFKPDEFAVANSIRICSNAAQVPFGYETDLNTAVCDDKLCANVLLKLYWDLAGNFVRFDTITGKPLTKFDHKRFADGDYKKLDQILKDRNSMLRVLEKSDLVDKSIKMKATSVDAVSGATPATIKKAVVEGAVYSSHTLWHFVNGQIKDSIRAFTLRNYSDQIAIQMLNSENYETQLFALKQIPQEQYESQFEILFQVIRKGSPLIRSYLINRAPLPFHDQEKNRKLALLYPDFDGYCKSVFIDRITSEKLVAEVFIPLMIPQFQLLDDRQQDKLVTQVQKFEISGLEELLKNYAGRNNP
jgi:hypothetical protein